MKTVVSKNADVIVTTDAKRRELTRADILFRGGAFAAIGSVQTGIEPGDLIEQQNRLARAPAGLTVPKVIW